MDSKLMILSEDDFDMLLEALENYKSKDFAGRVMSTVLDSMLMGTMGKYKDDPKIQLEIERKKTEDELKRLEEEEEMKILKRKIDVLKAKIIMIQEATKS